MTPQDKAKELYHKYYNEVSELDDTDMDGYDYNRKRYPMIARICALIAVDEMLGFNHNSFLLSIQAKEYWQQVKQEIEKL